MLTYSVCPKGISRPSHPPVRHEYGARHDTLTGASGRRDGRPAQAPRAAGRRRRHRGRRTVRHDALPLRRSRSRRRHPNPDCPSRRQHSPPARSAPIPVAGGVADPLRTFRLPRDPRFAAMVADVRLTCLIAHAYHIDIALSARRLWAWPKASGALVRASRGEAGQSWRSLTPSFTPAVMTAARSPAPTPTSRWRCLIRPPVSGQNARRGGDRERRHERRWTGCRGVARL
jgi:hypothetical protein